MARSLDRKKYPSGHLPLKQAAPPTSAVNRKVLFRKDLQQSGRHDSNMRPPAPKLRLNLLFLPVLLGIYSIISSLRVFAISLKRFQLWSKNRGTQENARRAKR